MPEAAAGAGIDGARARIRAGGLRGAELVAWIASRPAARRERDLDALLGVDREPEGLPPLPHGLIPHVPSGLVAILRSVLGAPLGPGDVLFDLGSGMGKVALAAHLLTGARAVGVELQPALAERAREAAADLRLPGVTFRTGDARAEPLDDATAVYLFAPFQGAALDAAMARVQERARARDLVICALSVDLGRIPWLRERPGDDPFLSIYDSRVEGAAPRPATATPALGPFAEPLALGREDPAEAGDVGAGPGRG